VRSRFCDVRINDPRAFIRPTTAPCPNNARLTQEIIAFCRERLAHYKCPDAIEFGPLPKTGKVQKFVLRQHEWAGQDRQISVSGA